MTSTPCQVWPHALNSNGYGVRRCGRRLLLAHRVAYAQAHGPIPAGLEVDHLCNVRACVNPDHLEAVTHAENVRRSFARRRALSDREKATADA